MKEEDERERAIEKTQDVLKRNIQESTRLIKKSKALIERHRKTKPDKDPE